MDREPSDDYGHKDNRDAQRRRTAIVEALAAALAAAYRRESQPAEPDSKHTVETR